MVNAITGSEVIQVLGQNPSNVPAAATFTVTLQQIAELAGGSGFGGTFIAAGTAPVTVANTNVAIGNAIVISLNTVGGTVGAVPAIKTLTAGVGFTVAATVGDTSTYNYAIIG